MAGLSLLSLAKSAFRLRPWLASGNLGFEMFPFPMVLSGKVIWCARGTEFHCASLLKLKKVIIIQWFIWAPTFLLRVFNDCGWSCLCNQPPKNPWAMSLKESCWVKTLHTCYCILLMENIGSLQMDFSRHHLICLFLLLVSLVLSFFSWLFLVVFIMSPPNDNSVYFLTIFISHIYFSCHIILISSSRKMLSSIVDFRKL